MTAVYLSDFSIRGGKDLDFGRTIRWDVDLLAGYRSLFLDDRAHRREPGGFWSLIVPQIWNELRSGRYDAVWLHGHNYAANLIGLLAAKTAGLHVLMRGETHLGLERSGVKRALRRPVMGLLYSQCDRLLAIGSANKAFYRAMGVPEHKIYLVPYTVDNERFVNAASLTDGERRKVRHRYGVPIDRLSILYAAKFTPRKRPLDLLEAARRLREGLHCEFSLVMVGAGELEVELRKFCVDHSLDNVVFPGFINQLELPQLYGASDIFVLPSEHEPWGLAVNEAMCAGLPIVASREVGCVPDLVADGVNGFTPAAGDIDALVAALGALIKDEAMRQRQGQASLDRIMRWSYRECAEGVRAALASLE